MPADGIHLVFVENDEVGTVLPSEHLKIGP